VRALEEHLEELEATLEQIKEDQSLAKEGSNLEINALNE
jgi:hypothetical protein